jgi:hypothetical protein
LNREVPPLGRTFQAFCSCVQIRRLARQLLRLLPSIWSTTISGGGRMIARCIRMVRPALLRQA